MMPQPLLSHDCCALHLFSPGLLPLLVKTATFPVVLGQLLRTWERSCTSGQPSPHEAKVLRCHQLSSKYTETLKRHLGQSLASNNLRPLRIVQLSDSFPSCRACRCSFRQAVNLKLIPSGSTKNLVQLRCSVVIPSERFWKVRKFSGVPARSGVVCCD